LAPVRSRKWLVLPAWIPPTGVRNGDTSGHTHEVVKEVATNIRLGPADETAVIKSPK
jgi:hypothetical protein